MMGRYETDNGNTDITISKTSVSDNSTVKDVCGYGKAAKLPQISASVVATLGSFLCGCALAWSAPALPHIQSDLCGDHCDIPNVTPEDASWIGALMPAGAAFSGIIAGWLMDRVGRRWTMIICALPFLVGSALYVLAYRVENEIPIYFARVLTGFSGGSFLLVAPLYIVEVSEPDMRGALASMSQLMLTAGIAYDNALSINDALGWNVISGMLIGVPVVICFGMMLLPESPPYLLSREQEQKARHSLLWLRGKRYDVDRELEDLKLAQLEKESAGSVNLMDLLSRREYVTPFFIVLALMFVQQFCGVNVVTFYIQTIFAEAGSDMDPGLSATLVSLAQMCGNFLAILIVDKVGRKVLLFVSSLGMAIALFSLGTFFYLEEYQDIKCSDSDTECVPQDGKFSSDLIDDLGWLPLASLIMYSIAFAIGVGPLPWAINAEMFTPSCRPLASSLAGAFNWTCAFLVTKFESDIESAFNLYGAYYFYASICLAGAAFVALLLPETRGRSPKQIQEVMGKRGCLQCHL